jgi:hypothetical protein
VLTEEAAQKLTYFVGLQWEDADRQVLEPLVDAALVWAFPDQLAQIALPIVETLWEDELREDIERALDDASSQHDEVRAWPRMRRLISQPVRGAAGSRERSWSRERSS